MEDHSIVINPGLISRVEIITDNGREYVHWDEKKPVQISLQGEGRTLKIFIASKEINEAS